MTLEAVVFQPDPFSCGNGLEGSRSWDHGFGFGGDDDQQEKGYAQHDMLNNGNIVGQGLMGYCSPSQVRMQSVNTGNSNSTPETCTGNFNFNNSFSSPMATTGRRKRRRTRNIKNKEEVETQRITHIAVERNRRKLMNDYLAALRSMMPASYAQRGDQASIIGGAINFVKELEQLLQSLEVGRRTKQSHLDLASIFSNFFTFPQYSTCSSTNTHGHGHSEYMNNNLVHPHEIMGEKRSGAIADVEVTMVESHANIKVLLKRHPRQLLKMVVGLHSLRLMILHLNVTTMDSMILYSFSVKVEDNSQLTSMNDIAADVYEMVGRIQEEAQFLLQ
ncbi:putative transcription factor bHLH family [Rosa chinensis]|uniref:Putative transcription factor bHLH family n=1 Tax=Rosa chinensis TaxID=74649 RepID=A0A2P6RQA8_ROSCH|nr:transcription factor bHLH94 isoform X2 [Rosa chinensis]PRQ48571.1 putative transcription factor bHLH family [Rosa chinensis]